MPHPAGTDAEKHRCRRQPAFDAHVQPVGTDKCQRPDGLHGGPGEVKGVILRKLNGPFDFGTTRHS